MIRCHCYVVAVYSLFACLFSCLVCYPDMFHQDVPPTGPKSVKVSCVSMCWSADGNSLFAGYTDGNIRVFAVTTLGR
eukprot:761736-Hanusia_phi.AAC.1